MQSVLSVMIFFPMASTTEGEGTMTTDPTPRCPRHRILFSTNR